MFKSLMKGVSNAASDVSREVGHVTRDLGREADKHWSHALLDNFRSGNVVALVSQSSGFSLQIVMSSSGQLVIDGLGPDGPTVYHAHWTVLNEGSNCVRLHNNYNYLAIVNGTTVLGNFPPPAQPGPETRFRVAMHGNFIVLESISEVGRHIGILQDGSVKSALATGKDINAHFAPKLIYSPYPVTTTQVTTTQVPKK